MSSAVLTRRKVAAAPSKRRRRSAPVTVRIINTASTIAQLVVAARATQTPQNKTEFPPRRVPRPSGRMIRDSRVRAEPAVDRLFDRAQVSRRKLASRGERCSNASIGEVTRSVDSTCSSLNLSLQAISGRHTTGRWPPRSEYGRYSAEQRAGVSGICG